MRGLSLQIQMKKCVQLKSLSTIFNSYSGYLVPLCSSKNDRNPNKTVSYSAALLDLKKLLQLLGFDPNLYGEHSGKRGGATAAAACGAPAPVLATWQQTNREEAFFFYDLTAILFLMSSFFLAVDSN